MARTAIGAGNEGVPATAISGIVQLALAGGARRDIGRNEWPDDWTVATLADDKVYAPADRDWQYGEAVDSRQRGRLHLECSDEGLEVVPLTLDEDLDVCGNISHVAREMKAVREPVHKRTKANPLHDPTHGDDPGLAGIP